MNSVEMSYLRHSIMNFLIVICTETDGQSLDIMYNDIHALGGIGITK